MPTFAKNVEKEKLASWPANPESIRYAPCKEPFYFSFLGKISNRLQKINCGKRLLSSETDYPIG